MESLHNLKLFAATLIIALVTGCAGITEANLSETDARLDAPAISAESTVQSAEAPGYFHGGDDPTLLDVRPEDGYEN